MENFSPATLADIERIEFNGEPVLTTGQLAQLYETTSKIIRQNFQNNRDRYIQGKHFYKLTGEALRDFKQNVKDFNFIDDREVENLGFANNLNVLYLWTKRGAARHCKSVGTDRAWDVFEILEENYFRPKPVEVLAPGAPFDFERGQALAKLVPHCKDALTKQRLIAKAANLILGEDFLPVPTSRNPNNFKQNEHQLTLLFH